MGDEIIIKIENLTKTFLSDGKQMTALKNINLGIKRGSVYGIIGLSGAGKSTLVRMMNLLETPTSGKVYFKGSCLQELSEVELRNTRKKIGMIFQNFNLLEQESVIKNVMFPLEISKVPKKKAIERAKELLKLVDLSEKENAYPSQLSGGQKQRVAIARALASNPEVILCDEATSALDPKTTNQILDLLKKINVELGVTIVIITHQMSVIESVCDEVTILHNSEIAEMGRVEDIFKSPKSEIGRKLIFIDKNQDDKDDILIDNNYKCLRIVYNGEEISEPVLSSLILKYNEPISILYGDIKSINGKAFGHMIIGIQKSSKNIDSITAFFEEKNIIVKELN